MMLISDLMRNISSDFTLALILSKKSGPKIKMKRLYTYIPSCMKYINHNWHAHIIAILNTAPSIELHPTPA